jgi:hypothetical protein
VSDPVTLFIEVATELSEPDLVAVGDALVLDPAVYDPRDPRPWIDLDELREGCARSRSPGCRAARRAAAQVRVGAESRPETLLRLLLVAAGIPEPELNPELFDGVGRLIGRADLVFRRERLIVEYDGDQHRTSTLQYERDMARIDRFLAEGWRVIRVRAHGLFVDPAATVARVRSALGA